MQKNVLVIPGEGNSSETLKVYIEQLMLKYPDANIKVLAFHPYKRTKKHYRRIGYSRTNILLGTLSSIDDFFHDNPWFYDMEIHAQGGIGAYIACKILTIYPRFIKRVFFIGGAPSFAMGRWDKFFHHHISRLWYAGCIPFSDNSYQNLSDKELEKATQRDSKFAIKRDLALYRDQLVFMSEWNLPMYHRKYHDELFYTDESALMLEPWKPGCACYYIPDGTSSSPYITERATKIWSLHGVQATSCPGEFSYKKMSPAEDLFKVMDSVRTF